MKRVALLLGISMLLVACGPKRETGFKTAKATTQASAEQITGWIAKGDEAWAGRGEETRLRNALEWWEKALAADPSNVGTLSALSRGYYLLADGYTTDLQKKINLHDKGAKYGERAFYLNEAFKKDPNPEKINLSVGVYKDAAGNTPVMNCVRQAEERILHDETTKNYLSIEGSAEYGRLVRELLLGPDHEVVENNRAITAHTPGGTGALRVAGDFIKRMFPAASVMSAAVVGVWVQVADTPPSRVMSGSPPIGNARESPSGAVP